MSVLERKHVSEGLRRFDVLTGGGMSPHFDGGRESDDRRGKLRWQGLGLWRRAPSRSVEQPLFVHVIVAPVPLRPGNEPDISRHPPNEGYFILGAGAPYKGAPFR